MNKDIDQVVAKQMKIIEFLSGEKLSEIPTERLSLAAIALATNNAYLGDQLADYQYKLEMTEATRKQVWADKYVEFKRSGIDGQKITQKDAEVFADIAVEGDIKEEIETRHSLQKIKMMRASCGDILTAIQTKISFAKEELRSSLMPNAK